MGIFFNLNIKGILFSIERPVNFWVMGTIILFTTKGYDLCELAERIIFKLQTN